MINRRFRQTLLALAGTCIFAAPSAFSLGKLGRGTVTASVTVDAEYDTNIFGNAVKTSDLSAIFTPQLSYTRAVGTVSTKADFGVRSISFTDTSGQDSVDPYMNVDFTVDRDQKGRVSLGLSYAKTTEANEVLLTRTDSDEFRGNTRIDYYYSDKTGVRMNADFRVSDFSSAGYNDVESYNIGGGIIYRYSPKLTADLTYGYSPEKAINTPTLVSNPNSTNHRLTFGLEGEIRAKVNGSISIGVVRRDFDINIASETMLLLASNIAWSASEKTTWTLSASNNFDTTPGAESARIFQSALGLQQSLTSKVTASLSAGYQTSALDQKPGPVARTDDAVLLRADLTYRLNDYYSARTGVSHRINTSTLALADYRRTVVSLGVSATF